MAALAAGLVAVSGCSSLPQATVAQAGAAQASVAQASVADATASRDALPGAAESSRWTPTAVSTASSIGAAAPAAGYAAMQPAGNGRTAEVMPEESDDAIIARRLRRAAEAETDPQARSRLWDEYARYLGHSPGP